VPEPEVNTAQPCLLLARQRAVNHFGDDEGKVARIISPPPCPDEPETDDAQQQNAQQGGEVETTLPRRRSVGGMTALKKRTLRLERAKHEERAGNEQGPPQDTEPTG